MKTEQCVGPFPVLQTTGYHPKIVSTPAHVLHLKLLTMMSGMLYPTMYPTITYKRLGRYAWTKYKMDLFFSYGFIYYVVSRTCTDWSKYSCPPPTVATFVHFWPTMMNQYQMIRNDRKRSEIPEMHEMRGGSIIYVPQWQGVQNRLSHIIQDVMT